MTAETEIHYPPGILKAAQRIVAGRKQPSQNEPTDAEETLGRWLDIQKTKGPKPGPMFGAVLMQTDAYAVGDDGVPYVYRGGVYVPASKHIKQQIKDRAGDAWTVHIQREVEAWIASGAPPIEPDALGPNRINVRNGILKWTGKRWRLFKHNPKYRTTIQCPVDWNPRAKCPRYDSFLESSLPDPEVRKMADEWMGFNLTADYSFHKALMTTGESGSGKSVYLNVLRALLGPESVSNVPLAKLAGNDFALADLYGKAANICTDISADELKKTGALKQLAAGEFTRGEKKFKDAFDFQNRAKLSFSANEVPASSDTTSAFFARWLVMIFPNRFRDTDRELLGLEDQLAADEGEMSGVLNRAVAGLTRLRANGEFTASQASRDALDQFREGADALAAFLTDLDPELLGRRKGVEWYRIYKDWCAESGHRQMTNKTFYKRMRAWEGALGVTVVRTKTDGFERFRIERGRG